MSMSGAAEVRGLAERQHLEGLEQPADDDEVTAGGEQQHRREHLVELAEDRVHRASTAGRTPVASAKPPKTSMRLPAAAIAPRSIWADEAEREPR